MRTRRHHGTGRAVATTLAALLVLGGCGSGDDEASDPGTPEPATSSAAASESPTESDADAGGEAVSETPDLCTLVTAADFESVLGEPSAGEPDSTPAAGVMRGMCTWTGEAGFPALMIGAYDAADREATIEMVDGTPVDGLGTEAHWADSTGLLIVVEDADWYLQVFVAGTDDDRTASMDLARIALANLPA